MNNLPSTIHLVMIERGSENIDFDYDEPIILSAHYSFSRATK